MKFLSECPREPVDNLEWRGRILFECRRKSGRYRAAVLRMCERDPLFWINSFVLQYNPLILGAEAGPFILRPAQESALAGSPGIFDSMTMGYDITVQKSREEGGSYLVALAYLHRWRFGRRQKFMMISHKEELVWDSGNHDALFSKVEYILDHLPAWMRGGWDKDDVDTWRKRFCMCPESKGVLTGLATTKKATIGGRYTSVMMDEFAHVEFGKTLRQRTTATTRSRIFVSTHAGEGTEFALLCDDPKVHQVVLHWTDNPRKWPGAYRWDAENQEVEVLDKGYQYPPDYPFDTSGEPSGGHLPGVRSVWYDIEANRIGDLGAVAEELDINRAGSAQHIFDPVLIGHLLARCEAPWWRGDLAFDEATGEPSGLVEQRLTGDIKLWGLKPNRLQMIPPGNYAAASDISQGTGNTPSSLVIGDIDRRQKVLELCRSDLDPREFAAMCVALCRLFRTQDGMPAKMVFEKTGPTGSSFEKKCLELHFTYLWQRLTSKKFLTTQGDKRYGWMATGKEKHLLLMEYYLALKRKEFYNPSKLALKQTLGFKKNKKGEPEFPRELPAPDGVKARFVHGDVVIADALLCMMFSDMGGPAQSIEAPAPDNEPHGGNPMMLSWRWALAEQQSQERDE